MLTVKSGAENLLDIVFIFIKPFVMERKDGVGPQGFEKSLVGDKWQWKSLVGDQW